jgi:phosphoserine phosphatase
MREINTKKSFRNLEPDKVVLMDLEGTLAKIYQPEIDSFGDVSNLEEVYSEEREGLHYWEVFQALSGEDWDRYNRRFSNWKSGDLSKEEFEEENIGFWNSMLEESEFESAEDLISHFNEIFLNLRAKAKDVVQYASEKGYEVGIISHAPNKFVKTAAKKVEADFIVPNVSFVVEEGRFTWVEENEITKDKSKVLHYLEDYVSEVVFVGNGKNDVSLSEAADSGYLIENDTLVDYSNVNAYTGSFDDVRQKLISDLGGKN